MKRDLIKTYKGRMFWDIGVGMLVSVSFLGCFLKLINYIYRYSDYTESPLAWIGNNMVLIYVMLFVILGNIVFIVVFALMQQENIGYVKKLSLAMKDIANGDLSRKVEVSGDDELAEMASALNNMASQLSDLIEKERKTEQSKNDLITNVAHDLRTPLTSMIGYLDILAGNPSLDEETKKKYLTIAHDKSVRLSALIEELFGFTKLNYGKLAMEVSDVDIVQLLEQIVDEFYPDLKKSDMEVETYFDVPSLVMRGDGNLIARLFDNLIKNAIKYGSEGKLLKIQMFYNEPQITINVINYGRIIPKSDLELIFEKFYRVEHSRSTETGGTGLGLAIAQNIAVLHGGRIEVSSSLEEGTKFCVTLMSNAPDL